MAKMKAESMGLMVPTSATVNEQLHDYDVMRGELGARMPAVVALMAEGFRGWKHAPDVEAWLADARACQAVYQSGNVVSVSALQALVNRAVGLLD